MRATSWQREAAAILWEAWEDGKTIPELPSECRPQCLDEGWAIQRQLDRDAGPAVGWKIAATSRAGQAHIGASGPVAGRIYEACVEHSGVKLDLAGFCMRSVEPEFAFRLGRDIACDGSSSEQELLACIAEVIPAIEVPDSRFDDFGAVGLPSLVADAMCVSRVVLGPGLPPDDAGALEQAVRVQLNGAEIASGSGALVLGSPLNALAWLAVELESRGLQLREGDVVMTGAAAAPTTMAEGDRVTAHFEKLGDVEVTFEVAADSR